MFSNDGQVYEDELDYHFNRPQDKPEQDQQSNGPKKIYFVRHGDTNLNVESGENSNEQPVRGWSPVSLNQAGRDQARKAADSVKDKPIDHIVSSDLPRAAETARIISNKTGWPVEYDPGLRTWNLGEYTGKAGKEVHDAVDKLCKENQDERPEGGESFNEFKDRVLSTMSNIVQRHNDKELLIVSHNSPERVLHAWTEAGQPQKQEAGILDTIKRMFQSSPKPDTSMNLSHDPHLVHPGMGFNMAKDKAFLIENADLSSEKRTELYQKYSDKTPLSMGSEHAEEFNKSIEAIKRSPVSLLGFDPTHNFITRDAGLTTKGGTELGGTVWSNAFSPTSLIHESMHRGLDILQKAGYPISDAEQEMIVRRLMYKHFGDYEGTEGSVAKQQMLSSLSRLSDADVSKIEETASEHYKKLHPGLKDGQ